MAVCVGTEGRTDMFKPTMVYLEPEQLEKLREQARRQRISMAELVRRIVPSTRSAG